jgi:hypothetical protein
MDRTTRDFIEGLASFGVIFMQLKPSTKRTTRGWDYFENLHEQQGESRVDLVSGWLKDGYGVGYLPRQRLAAIDADDAITVKRIADFEEGEVYLHLPKVHTPSGGVHALFVHPPSIDLSRLKNHVCHPQEDGVKIPWDFKLGERTMLVAPGTVMPKGVYKAGVWMPPPVLDIRTVAPELEIFKNLPEFLRDTRPKKDRIIRAMTYLRTQAPISIKGKHSRSTLWTVAKHLVPFLDLDPGLAFYLMTESKKGYTAWNERCLGEDGKPSPWDLDELLDALHDAVDAAPDHGIYLYQRAEEREFARWCLETFLVVLTYLPPGTEDDWLPVGDLFRAFLDYSGLKSNFLKKSEFGNAMTKAIDSGRFPFVQRDRTNKAGRIYRGISIRLIGSAVREYEQRQAIYLPAA